MTLCTSNQTLFKILKCVCVTLTVFISSALELERVLLEHRWVTECAVVGIPDKTWGEKVAAVLVPAESSSDKVGICSR